MDAENDEPECITPEEMADKLQVSRDHVYRMLRGGFVRGVKIGRRHIIPRSEVDRILGELQSQEVRDLREYRSLAG